MVTFYHFFHNEKLIYLINSCNSVVLDKCKSPLQKTSRTYKISAIRLVEKGTIFAILYSWSRTLWQDRENINILIPWQEATLAICVGIWQMPARQIAKLLVCVGKSLPKQKNFFKKKQLIFHFFTTFKITKSAVVNSVSCVIST